MVIMVIMVTIITVVIIVIIVIMVIIVKTYKATTCHSRVYLEHIAMHWLVEPRFYHILLVHLQSQMSFIAIEMI